MSPLLPFLNKKLRVVDLGGTSAFWRTLDLGFQKHWKITLFNLSPSSLELDFEVQEGDATKLNPEDLKGFDLIFSNSVIEHLGTWAAKRALANTIISSGVSYFVQTPNYWFPMEPHWLIPGFQFFPRPFQKHLLMKGYSPRLKEPTIDIAEAVIDEIQLLTHKDMEELFPSALLMKESALGLTKSFVAYNLNSLSLSQAEASMMTS